MRVKGGTTRGRRHNKVLKATKGYRMTKNNLYRVAHEAYLHAGQYSYAHRRRKHSEFRGLWIKRVNAGAQENGMKYGQLMGKLRDANILLNTKVLADIALNNPEVFTQITKAI